MNHGGLKNAATESRLDSKRERRRGAAGRPTALRRAPSDSDGSGETALSTDSGDRAIRSAPPPARSGKSRGRRRGSEWEVLEGLKDGQRFDKKPDTFNGYLHKKRKWPLKGWHKRYFVIDGGILVYARSSTDISRGRLHGSVDVGLSVISAKAGRRRIDIDADEFIYHLRAKTPDVFRTWLNVLKTHRLYRQHLLTFGARESLPKIHAPLEDLTVVDGSKSGGPLENASKELGQAQLSVQQLQRLLDALELQQQVHHDTDALSALTAPPSPGGGASSIPNSAASLPIACAAARPQSLPGAESLATGTVAGPASLTSLTPDHQLREDFSVLAKDLVTNLKTILSTLVCERGRLRAAVETLEGAEAAPGGAVLAALRTNLTSALHQNSELRSRLSRIHDASDLAEISSMGPNSDAIKRHATSLSYSSSCVSASEFFDAEEHDNSGLKSSEIIAANEGGVIELEGGDSSSEAGSLSSEEGSASSDNSDAVMSAEQVTLRLNQNGPTSGATPAAAPRPSVGARAGAGAGPGAGGAPRAPGPPAASQVTRRSRLPCPRPTPGGPSLWNLLYKNIGKDLSQISMPVTINEPLNMLQKLCEELEYSELLDAAADCTVASERMSLVAAFAVSSYSSSAHRAASKPFNPLLAETYECIRDDKGFRFIAEQVSHHPPISACHAESSRWTFWQEARIKTKFWGKSMEFQPTGRVHVRLTATGDHYYWNKVTTCVHNLFGGQRWVDQYGDMHITCKGTNISCKLNFIKASSWTNTRHEVRGAVSGGGPSLRLQGRWSEALYAGERPTSRCLWRPGPMPPDHEQYYGFTRFAMELNELEPGMKEILPHTDTRLRPDQRALEDGDVEAAERFKLELEQAQRDRRRDEHEHTPAWFRKATEDGEEVWIFTGEYWKAREAGFVNNTAPKLW